MGRVYDVDKDKIPLNLVMKKAIHIVTIVITISMVKIWKNAYLVILQKPH